MKHFWSYFIRSVVENTCYTVNSLAVESGFGQKFKPDPRVGVRPGWTDQSSQPDPRVGVRRVLPSLSETSYIEKGEKKFFVNSI